MTRRFSGDKLVIATHSRGKLDEFARLFSGRGIALSCAADFGLPAPEETGATFLENAKIKALFTARETGIPALADDSGLCVNALNGAPGVYSADWAGAPRDFKKAMQKVHDALGDAKDRSAAFACCLVLAWPDGHCAWVEGRAEGDIIWPPRGAGTFGYDPFFQPVGSDKTYAEISAEEKNAISHRAKAFRLLVEKCF